MNCDFARIIQITNLKSMGQIEDRIRFKPMSKVFSQHLNTEVSSPELFEIKKGDWNEHMLGVGGHVRPRPMV
jgi:hypothetical protein